MSQKTVYINRIAKFLPGNPVANEDMEKYLGFVGGDFKSKSKVIILRNNKIKTRYYALTEEGKSTHTNAQMTANAVKSLEGGDFKLSDIQVLACGTTSADQILPSHASMVHGELGFGQSEAIGFSGSCCAGTNALKYAYMSVLSGLKDNAVATGSERFSHWMLANNFKEEAEKIRQLEENPMLSFEKDFLRWMLSDGAGAALLSNSPNKDGLSLRIDAFEITSFAYEIETCMYAGGDKEEDGSLKGWANYDQEDWVSKSLFAVKQDTRLLDKYITQLGAVTIRDTWGKHGLKADDVDWFLVHISSEFFRDKLAKQMEIQGIPVPQDKWFLNLTTVGNVGAASIYLALEELVNSGRLQKGQRVALAVPESARFAYTNVILTVV